jgi:hypothetical protein
LFSQGRKSTIKSKEGGENLYKKKGNYMNFVDFNGYIHVKCIVANIFK